MPSTVIRRFDYHPALSALDVEFVSGRRYRYAGVPVEVAEAFRAAFSKGRFAIETPGLATLYVPSYPEITRVIEDCR